MNTFLYTLPRVLYAHIVTHTGVTNPHGYTYGTTYTGPGTGLFLVGYNGTR